MDAIERRLRLLYKDVQKAKKDDEEECQDNIDVLEGIKNELIDEEKLGSYDLEDISIGGWLGTSKEDILEANKELIRQLKKISKGLGIDLDEKVQNPQIPISNSPIINIHQIQSQHQEQHQNQKIEIEILKKELENELRKNTPDESKVKKIVNNIIEVAKSSAPAIITGIVLKVLGV